MCRSEPESLTTRLKTIARIPYPKVLLPPRLHRGHDTVAIGANRLQPPSSEPPVVRPKTRLSSVQVCRGLAALAVVFAHLHNLERKYFTTDLLGGFQIGVAGVDLFFVISGVVISAVTLGRFSGTQTTARFGQAQTAIRFLYQRVTRIYPIYWVYCSFALAAYLYNPLWINASGGHHVEILHSFLLIPSDVPMLLLQGWTLIYELYFYLAFFLLLLFCPERKLAWVLPLWGVLALVAHFTLHPSQPALEVLFNPLICEFLLGCLVFALFRRASLHPAAGIVLVAASLVMLAGIVRFTALAHGSDQQWIEYSSWTRLLLYGTCATLFLLGLLELERTNLVRFVAPLIAVGDWSYSIYLSHTIVIKLVSHAFVLYFPQLAWSIVWVSLLSLPAVLLVGYLSYTWLERPLLRLLYRPLPRPTETVPHASGLEKAGPDKAAGLKQVAGLEENVAASR